MLNKVVLDNAMLYLIFIPGYFPISDFPTLEENLRPLDRVS